MRNEAPSMAADARIAFTSERDGYARLYVPNTDETVEQRAPDLWASYPACGHDPDRRPELNSIADLGSDSSLTGDGVLTYVCDAANRLRAVNDGTLQQLLDYGALGNPVRQTLVQPGQPTLTTDYLLDIRTDLSQLPRETTPGGPRTDETWYLPGLDVIGQQHNGAWSYFGYDGLGSVRHLSDEYGGVTGRVNCDPYGLPLNTLPSSLGFAGELTDPMLRFCVLQSERAATP